MTGKLFKKISVLLTAGILAATSVNVAPVQAEEQIDLDRKCTITYQMETGAHSTKVTADGGNLEIYQVADIQSGDTGYYYSVLSDFEGAGIDFAQYTGDEGQAEFEKNNSEWAETLASYITKNSIQPIRTENFKNGYLKIDDLSVGLYLMVQTKSVDGYETLSPFLVSVPVKDESSGSYLYTVDASVKMAAVQKKTPENPNPEKPKPAAPTHTGDKLPQTGQLWWPIPILIAAGVVLIIVGTVRKKKSKG